MQAALELPSGARFYRCALQVNPFAYLQRHAVGTDWASEDEYNEAIIRKCLSLQIEVIAVTDHYRVKSSRSLVCAARAAGIYAFSGFEAVTSDGVHFLCLFDPDQDDRVERYIGKLVTDDAGQASPTGELNAIQLLESSRKWGAVCIAVHVAAAGGLLKKLSGQSRVNAWKSPYLLACALPGPASAAPESIRQILENKDPQHKRERLPAILNASDVNGPLDLEQDSASCFLKMSQVSVEGFRQAFLDPESRVRLHSDPQPQAHAEFLAITWETNGFLRDTAVHFNANLNVLVGGRGTGKSTIIESIRYALGLEPLGEDARHAHDGVIRKVLQSGTKVSLLVRSHKPSQRCYTIERSVPNPPVVRDDAGEVLALTPAELLPGVEVFGQHEISELARSPEKLTGLLRRFVDRDFSSADRKAELRLELEQSRGRIMEVRRQIQHMDERLAALPGLEETQTRFQQAGLEERLKEKSLLVREERLFASLGDRLNQYRTLQSDLVEGLPVDTTFVSAKALAGLPNADLLAEIEIILATLSTQLDSLGEQFEANLAEAERAIAALRPRWNERRTAVEATYEATLRELQKSNIDGAEFIQLRREIEALRPLRDQMAIFQRDLKAHETHRRNLLAEFEDVKAREFRNLQTAEQRVSRRLGGKVRVKVTMGGNRVPLEQLLREVGGNLAAALERLRSQEQLSLQDLAHRCREGKDSLMQHYDLPAGAAERIAQADAELFMRIEELELPATTDIELNTAPEHDAPVWQKLEDLSTGQKATAVLLLLLLESEAPLVVDQPEDDLDNRFITEDVVPIMRREKRRRQFVFSTHNANIPVLGDAELILGLAATGDARGEGYARIARERMGSIDSSPVRELVEDILEGGKAAFEMRRSKYGF